MEMDIVGALMVGGRSERMGTAKSLIPKAGTTLDRYLAHLLEKATGKPPVLVGSGETSPACGILEKIDDREPGAGPLSGLLGLFDRFPKRDFIVLATDLFAMDEHALDWLLGRFRLDGRPAIRPRQPDRPFGEPLASIYRSAAGPLLDRRWRQGVRSLHQALTGDEVSEPLIPHRFRLAFRNVNTPEALDRFRLRLDGH